MMIIFFDTETTGLPNFKAPSSDPEQPHIVQLAGMLTDDNGVERGCFSAIIRPDGWVIPDEVAAIHGITTEIALAYGIPADAVLGFFAEKFRAAKLAVAHNTPFDQKIIKIGMHRHFGEGAFDALWPSTKRTADTMRAATPIVNLPPTEKMRRAGFNKPKNASLGECWQHFFGENLSGAHDAMVDVRGCARVFFHLRQIGAIAC